MVRFVAIDLSMLIFASGVLMTVAFILLFLCGNRPAITGQNIPAGGVVVGDLLVLGERGGGSCGDGAQDRLEIAVGNGDEPG